MKWIALATACALLLSGCAEDRQLARYQDWTKEGQWQKIVDDPVVDACADRREPCGRLHALRGDACHEVGMSARVGSAACPPNSAKDPLVCAAEEYKAAGATPDSKLTADKLAAIRVPRAQALYCRAEMSSPAEGLPLAREALSLVAKPNGDKAAVIASQAALYVAVNGSAAERCAAARQAETLASEGLSGATDPASRDALRRVAADAKLVQRHCGG